MKFTDKDLLLYAVTDRSWLNGSSLAGQVREAIEGGATFIQLREKNLDRASFLEEAYEIKAICKEYGVPFVINDDVSVAVVSDADGVHVGQSDMESGAVRKEIGDDKILGVSVQTVEAARLAQARGADYLGVGAVFPTSSKDDADAVSFETLKAICEAVSIPVVAIGGINKDNIAKLEGSGIKGVAVISAIFAAKNIKAATRELRTAAAGAVEN